jgi:hypothetical protein
VIRGAVNGKMRFEELVRFRDRTANWFWSGDGDVDNAPAGHPRTCGADALNFART